jgi:hypothetical protein
MSENETSVELTPTTEEAPVEQEPKTPLFTITINAFAMIDEQGKKGVDLRIDTSPEKAVTRDTAINVLQTLAKNIRDNALNKPL